MTEIKAGATSLLDFTEEAELLDFIQIFELWN